MNCIKVLRIDSTTVFVFRGGASLLKVINSAIESFDIDDKHNSGKVQETSEKELKQAPTNETLTKSKESNKDSKDIVILDGYIIMKDHFFEKHLLLIKTLIIKLFNIDRGLKHLEEKATSLDLSKRTEKDHSEVKIDKKYVEQVESQLQDFVKEKNEIKKKKKSLEKKCSLQCKEKESLICECLNLKAEIERLRIENTNEILKLRGEIQILESNKCVCDKIETEIQKLETEKCECEKLKHQIEQMQNDMHDYENLKHKYERLQNEKCDCEHMICQISCLEKEKKALKRKTDELVDENRKTLVALVTLNEENRNLSNTIDNIRHRTDKTSNLTSKEISQLNTTIEELQMNLEQTRFMQDKEEKSYQDTIINLNHTIFKLEGQLTSMFNKSTSDKSVICTKGKSKVSFLEESAVQVDMKSKYEKELNEVLDINAKMSQELKRKAHELEFLKEKVTKLETALNSCEERATNLQQAVDLSLNSIELLVSSEEHVNNEYWMQSKDYEILQDLSIDLEMEHFENLQSIEFLNCQVNKYQMLLKDQEKENGLQVKKLSKQKKCYEEIVNYFKDEISIMADQLNNLQELLTLSNESSQQESQKYINAFMEMQNLNTKLSEQLCLCQQNISNHDETIDSIRQKLQCSLQQNQELQMTIIELNETIIELQNAVKIHERENCSISQSARECKQQLDRYNETLEELKQGLKEKSSECERFKQAYFDEKKALKELQNELDLTQRKLQENQFDLVGAMEDLKEKLTVSEDNYNKIAEEHKELQSHLANVTRKEAVKDQEIKRYRKIVGDLKNTMVNLNSELDKTLCQKELKKKYKKTNNCNCSKARGTAENENISDICECPCEVEFYQNMVDMLKNSVIDLQNKLADVEAINKQLEEQIKSKDEQIEELQNGHKLKSMESNECECLINKLQLELEATKQNERKYEALAKQLDNEINQLRQELQSKCKKINEESKKCKEINSSKCIQLVRVQEELHILKEEMAVMINKQAAFNKESEKVRAENVQLHCTIQCLRDRSRELQEALIQYQNELCGLTGERNNLIRTNRELLHELKTIQLQACYSQKNNQERELQRQNQPQRSPPKPINQPCNSRQKRQAEVVSPVSLGSQGMASANDHDSLPASPCTNDMCDWYSTNFRTESDYTDDEEICVNKLNTLTLEMRKSNRLWKEQNRCYSPDDYGVSRDKK